MQMASSRYFNYRNPETTDAAGAHKRLLYPVPVHKHRGEPDKLTNHKNGSNPPRVSRTRDTR